MLGVKLSQGVYVMCVKGCGDIFVRVCVATSCSYDVTNLF